MLFHYILFSSQSRYYNYEQQHQTIGRNFHFSWLLPNCAHAPAELRFPGNNTEFFKNRFLMRLNEVLHGQNAEFRRN